jgi:hypothetical protein
MVRVGFIVEGDTEKIIVESDSFRAWAKDNGIEICSPVINAKGGGNLLPQNILPSVAQLRLANAKHIVILTDLDEAPDTECVKTRIGAEHTDLIFVAVKAIEAWFLADTAALNKWLKLDDVFENAPEATPGMPWERLKVLAAEKGSRGPGNNKPLFAMKMCKQYGFLVAHAAIYANCPSAALFHHAILRLANYYSIGGRMVSDVTSDQQTNSHNLPSHPER